MHAEIDLLPDTYRQSRMNLGRVAGWSLVVAVLAAAIAFTGISTYWRQADARVAVADLRQRVADMQQWTAPVPGLIAEIEALHLSALSEDVLTRATDWVILLADMSMASSDALRLTDVMIAAPAPDTEGGGTLLLSGVAQNDQEILRFLREFQQSPAVRSLDLDMSSTATGQDGTPYNLFSIRGELALMDTEQ